MSRPDFIAEAQASQFPSHVGLKAWANRQQETALGHGCIHVRVSHDPAAVGHVLIEGWKEQPVYLGEPAWGQANV